MESLKCSIKSRKDRKGEHRNKTKYTYKKTVSKMLEFNPMITNNHVKCE